MIKPYFADFDDITPPKIDNMSEQRLRLWHISAGVVIGLALWYLQWRWTVSLNPKAMIFSITVALAETMIFIGTILFFYDIWCEKETPKSPPPKTRSDLHLGGDGNIYVDLFVTTVDEGADLVSPSIIDAKALNIPAGVSLSIYVLDDGNRDSMRQLAKNHHVGYLSRQDNIGYKAGNLRNALLQTKGDFVVICDADTRVFPGFLQNTLGYFRDAKTAWVQTPHWFYDIPQGETWDNSLARVLKAPRPGLARLMRFLTGNNIIGRDPFLSDPVIFFDVIQRRRNRNNASFCCGAGSIHRREAIFANALQSKSQNIARLNGMLNTDDAGAGAQLVQIEPFKFHVSEDIFTSIQLHSRGWHSVFHPDIEARMLSPWTMKAWSTQRLKYAGGTYDIMLRANPIFRRGMPWQTKLHYAATFWSYLSVLWLPILLFAPVISLMTGLAPVKAYSFEFFMHFLPLLLVNEFAMYVACKGYNTHGGRMLAVSAFPLQLRGLWQVLRRKKLGFPPTPKTLFARKQLGFVYSSMFILAVFAASVGFGIWAFKMRVPGYSYSLLIVNFFWIFWNSFPFIKIISMSLWNPEKGRPCGQNNTMNKDISYAQ
ncbi:MAG: glycosyltransferase [Paracoccaceae bacterium]